MNVATYTVGFGYVIVNCPITCSTILYFNYLFHIYLHLQQSINISDCFLNKTVSKIKISKYENFQKLWKKNEKLIIDVFSDINSNDVNINRKFQFHTQNKICCGFN